MTEGTMLTIGGGAIALVLLGAIGAMFSVSDAEVAKRTERKASREEVARQRLERRAFRPARWWEFMKKRDQAIYYGKARPRFGSEEENAQLCAWMHSIDHLCEQELERMARMRQVKTVFFAAAAAVVGTIVALINDPLSMSKVLAAWTAPVVAVVGGALTVYVGQSKTVQDGREAWRYYVSIALIVLGVGLVLYGLVAGFAALLAWNGWVLL